jgi:hypothetical protein
MINVPSTFVIIETITGNTVWQNGRFVPGTPGVSSGYTAATGIVFVLASGSYSFSLQLAV